MTRSNAREILLHLVFEMDAGGETAESLLSTRFAPDYYATLAAENELYAEEPDEKAMAYITSALTGIEQHITELDEAIRTHSNGWSIDRISRIARAVMQVAIYEMRYAEDVPVSSAINEAVELTRRYEEEDTVRFVNGILGAVSREQA